MSPVELHLTRLEIQKIESFNKKSFCLKGTKCPPSTHTSGLQNLRTGPGNAEQSIRWMRWRIAPTNTHDNKVLVFSFKEKELRGENCLR